MTTEDEKELDRLSGMLRLIDGQLDAGSPLREALEKSGIALTVAFLHDLRAEVERHYASKGEPLGGDERSHLRGLGIDPDE